ncbi:hypothetical protein ACJA88_013641 [Fusarium oxysporum]
MTMDQGPVLKTLQDISLSAHTQPTDNPIKCHVADREHCATPCLLPERESEAWQKAIEKVARGVVYVKFSHPYNFDTEFSKTSEATGFVVDAERGLVLTNRHVVGPGPFSGYIVFNDQEEVDAYPIYCDPVHEFGFLKFDPRAVNYMELIAIPLRPNLARVGTEVRVIGNDSGEQLSILSGTISRLDRNPPIYDGYVDFNTCYFQANASASGGSSGSPVIDIDGHGIALQAGARIDGSTDYFLPLDGPLRALKQLQKDEKVKRGEIQTIFKLQSFDKCRQLGLCPAWEIVLRKRFPGDNNALVVLNVLPEGPSDGKLKQGDILIKIDGDLITQFLRLNEIFVSNIGKTVRILVQRDGHDIEEDIPVQDLSQITPDRFVTVGSASFHNLSYQIAQRYVLPCRGVYICQAGPFHPTVKNYIVVESINHTKTPTLDAFVEVMKDIPDRARVAIKFWYVMARHTVRTAVISIDRHWFQRIKIFKRNDITGVWDVEVLAEALPAIPPSPLSGSFDLLKHIPLKEVAEVMRSFVHVKFSAPILIDGHSERIKHGMGLVVDANRGYIIVSRTYVPTKLCDIELTFAESVLVPGKVLLLHPSHHYAIIQYNTSLVNAPVKSAKFSTERMSQGESTFFIGYTDSDELVYTSTIVSKITPLKGEPPNPPRGRPINIDKINVEARASYQSGSGVLIGGNGVIQALWIAYEYEDLKEVCFGLSSHIITPITEKLHQGIVPSLRSLGVELEAVTMIEARVMGVSEEWIKQVQSKSSDRLLFILKRSFSQLPDRLQEGDILLTLDGELITQLSDIDVMLWKESLDTFAVRNCETIHFKVQTIAEDEFETSHIVNFCGLTTQKPHRTVRQCIKKLPSEVYITSRLEGSPSNLYNVCEGTFITQVDNKPTPDLESLMRVIANIPDRIYFKIEITDYSGSPSVVAIKKDERYFPTVECVRDDMHAEGWRRITYENGEVVQGEGLYGISL